MAWELFLSTPSARRATSQVDMARRINKDFYPRPPRGGRPFRDGRPDLLRRISIHALREEGDLRLLLAGFAALEFLSTPSARRATRIVRAAFQAGRISIHALREEGDPDVRTACTACALFLSTPSARRATPDAPRATLMRKLFLSTPSARRATAPVSVRYEWKPNFYPRPPRGGRLAALSWSTPSWGFLSTPSARRATTRSGRPLWS